MTPQPPNTLNVAVLCDYLEERWYSMDLVGEMLMNQLASRSGIRATRICPTMTPRAARLPLIGVGRAAHTADRLLNRFHDYPRFISRNLNFDVYHIVDHSYANLVYSLPADRVVVTCHDLDAFRCLIEPEKEPRSLLFKTLSRRILSGLRKAAVVACDSYATRDELLTHGLIDPSRLIVVPLGYHPTCTSAPDIEADAAAASYLGPVNSQAVDILHVGSTVPRKRIDLLLRVFHGVREQFPQSRLIRVGGTFNAAQQELINELGLESSVVALPHVSREVLAAIYRRSTLALLPSDREGFGLPVAEAMACGTPVVATDLPVLREIGGDVTAYCPAGDAGEWIRQVSHMVWRKIHRPEEWLELRAATISQSARFTWRAYELEMTAIYRKLTTLFSISSHKQVLSGVR